MKDTLHLTKDVLLRLEGDYSWLSQKGSSNRIALCTRRRDLKNKGFDHKLMLMVNKDDYR